MKYLPRAGDNNEIKLLLSKIRYCYLLSQIRYLLSKIRQLLSTI
jgi:hypothetical protein